MDTDSRYSFSRNRRSLTIRNVTLRDDGEYRLLAVNLAGNNSDFVTLTVNGMYIYSLMTLHSVILSSLTSAEPYIMETGGTTIARDSGQTFSFNCTADGVPTPAIAWLRDNSALLVSLDSRLRVEMTTLPGLRPDITESRRSVLTISDLTVKDSGSYSCKATNGIGTDAVLQEPYQLDVAAGILTSQAPIPAAIPL